MLLIEKELVAFPNPALPTRDGLTAWEGMRRRAILIAVKDSVARGAVD